MSKKGFTLVEVLVVIAVLSIIGLVVITIFTRSLRGINKSQIISSLKQNGASVLENMDKSIRNADNLVCISNYNITNPLDPLRGDTLVIKKDGIYTRYRFVPQTQLLNGYIAQDNPQEDADETYEDFINRVCSPTDFLLDQHVILTDTNLQTGISVFSGSFKLDDKPGFKISLTIEFLLKPGLQAPAVVSGQIDPVTFQTTVQLRNSTNKVTQSVISIYRF